MKTQSTAYQPKTGQPCTCKRGQQRDNCPQCEGTGQRIDFKAIRTRLTHSEHAQKAGRVDGYGAVLCACHDMTFGGLCLSCGWEGPAL